MAGIARELVEGAEGQFAELKSQNADTSRKEISSQAHALRGCLLNFGFTDVGKILVDIMRRARPTPTRSSKVKIQSALRDVPRVKEVAGGRSIHSVGIS